MKRLALVALLLGVASVTRAEDYTDDGNYLLKVCGEAVRLMNDPDARHPSYSDSAYCFGFMSATYYSAQILEDVGERTYCLPSPGGPTNGQLARIAVKYLTNHPEQLHEGGYRLAFVAIGTAFPCEK